MPQLAADDYAEFISSKPTAAIHFDADWDATYRNITRGTMRDAAVVFGDHIGFAEVDCDAYAELARSILIVNIPTVAYYRKGELVVAQVGANQNVCKRVESFLRDEAMGSR